MPMPGACEGDQHPRGHFKPELPSATTSCSTHLEAAVGILCHALRQLSHCARHHAALRGAGHVAQERVRLAAALRLSAQRGGREAQAATWRYGATLANNNEESSLGHRCSCQLAAALAHRLAVRKHGGIVTFQHRGHCAFQALQGKPKGAGLQVCGRRPCQAEAQGFSTSGKQADANKNCCRCYLTSKVSACVEPSPNTCSRQQSE